MTADRPRHCPICGGVKAPSYPICVACSIIRRLSAQEGDQP